MSVDNRCKCCRSLYSLAAECLVVTITLIHVLLSSVELMIHLDVIQVPVSETDDSKTENNNTLTNSTSTPSPSYDPGGCDGSLHPNLSDTVNVARYATLVISALFFLEICCKVYLLRKYFFKDIWQLFDTFIVLLSLGIEIAFFLVHEKLLCYSPVTEAATFVVVLRLWRLPRACNVRKNEYKAKLEDEHRYLRQTKTLTERRCKDLQKLVQSQTKELENLKSVLRKNNIYVTEESEKISNGNVNGGLSATAIRTLHLKSPNDKASLKQTEQCNGETYNTASNNTGSNLDRNDSDKNSRANDSGIEVKDSFRSDKELTTVYDKSGYNNDEVFDSDGSEFPVSVRVQEVEVQIEEISRQKQLPSVTSYRRSIGDDDDDTVLLRLKSSSSAAACVNAGYDEDVDEPDSGTYRSADGIPMTEL